MLQREQNEHEEQIKINLCENSNSNMVALEV